MKSNDQLLLSLLSNNDVTFYIPPYQRNYEWTETQCSVFFEDIVKVAESNLNNIFSEHFFGTIVYVQNEHIFGEPTVLVLTDGQQRITTTMLFLAAVRDCLDDIKSKEFINKKYLKNENITSDTEFKIKLKQVEKDWDSYKNIILNNKISDKDKTTAVWKNYNYFKTKVTRYIEQEKKNIYDLVEKGITNFRIVTIELEPKKNFWENPQEVFESMNSLGKPLSLADLVRNYILLGKSPNEQEELYHNYWIEIENNLPDKVSDFIRDYMQLERCSSYKKATEKNFKELYSQFKELFGNQDATVLLKDLKKYSGLYAQVALGQSTGNQIVDNKLSDLRSIDITTLYSFLVKLLDEWNEQHITDQDILDILDAFMVYFLRRKILKLSQGENKAFPKLIKLIPSIVDSENKKNKIYTILGSQEYALRLPNDIEVKQQLSVMNFYNFSYCKFILSLIEEKITKYRPDKNDKNLQIEHIMPRKLNEEWQKSLGKDYERIHQEYVNTIGNLTLIRHNQELGNKPFIDKKKVYENNAGLQIAKTKITDVRVWNEESILSRKNWIVDYVLNDLISIPTDMKMKNNYETKESKLFSFKDHGLVGKEISYIYDSGIIAKVLDDRNVEFEGKKWKLSPLVCELETRRGTVNNSKAYHGPSFWKYDNTNITEYYDVDNE